MGYYGGNVGGINNCGCYYGGGNRNGSAFALIVVLFILLIIVGATFMNRDRDC
ncbi:YjcZ family sporulation protein [Lysinibacillus xylanilyticus]|uniref:YjcZ family sporulation protein n=1 Tax=Lysinibacillus xylanilyticus TaxID=582475 RepID=UPI003816AE31